MTPDTITISSKIDTKTFRDFAVFDTLIRQRRLVSPAIFCGIFLIFALICFLMRGRAPQAALLGFVMLSIAIILPAAYLFMFFHSVSQKAKELHLDTARLCYTLRLTDALDGITVDSAIRKTGTLRVNWDQIHHAYRTGTCIYLYVSPRQAFLLPDHQATVGPDQLWSYLGSHLSPEKMTDRRR